MTHNAANAGIWRGVVPAGIAHGNVHTHRLSSSNASRYPDLCKAPAERELS
jgi:hypothetical protein